MKISGVLERNFKKYVDDQNKTGRGRRTFEFYTDLQDIFLRKKNIYPQILLTSNQTVTPQSMPLHTQAQIDGDLEEKVQPSTSAATESKITWRRKRKRQTQFSTSHLQDELFKQKIFCAKNKTEYYKRKIELDEEFIAEIKEMKSILKNICEKLSRDEV